MEESDEFITESELGTQEYWDSFYEEEIENFDNHGDEGESWFGKANTMKIVKWVSENVHKDAKICDLGCGNGVLLGKLHERGFKNLTGIDYSPKSIDLCKRIHSETSIKFEQADILREAEQSCDDRSNKFDVLLDKGTYDAIALMPNTDIEESRRKYKLFLSKKLSSNGRFVLMSCNFTMPEVEKFLLLEPTTTNGNVSENLKFIKEYVFEMPTLTFGGAVGQQVVGIVCQRIV